MFIKFPFLIEIKRLIFVFVVMNFRELLSVGAFTGKEHVIREYLFLKPFVYLSLS